MGGIEELIAKLEAANGPDRELDCEIGVAIGRFHIEEHPYRGKLYCEGDTHPGNAGDMLVPRYTASIDAALTLVSSDCWVQLSWPISPEAYGYSREDERAPRASLQFGKPPYGSAARAATPALALCIAALRARALAEAAG